MKFLNIILYSFIFEIFCLSFIKSKPKNVIPTNEQITFMQQFGYLDEPKVGFAAQYTKETIIEAIKNIQKFGNISQTGLFDNQTIMLMKRRRCGVKDIIKPLRSKRYTVIGQGWKTVDITYRVVNSGRTINESVVKSELKRALDIWAKNADLTFTYVDGDEANIKISFHTGDHGDAYAFDGPGGILGHAFFPYVPHSGEVHFDDEEKWAIETNYDTYSTGFFLAVIHELGHALGLGHSDVPTAVMFPYYSDIEPSDLDEDDINGLRKLYSFNTNNNLIITDKSTSSNNDNNSNEICSGFDTLAVIQQHLYVFIGNKIWKYKERGNLIEGYPMKIHTVFPHLPHNKKIDAAYEKHDGSIVFFIGDYYWIYKNDRAQGPFPIEDYISGVPIDAVFLWPINEKFYIFTNNQFWRYNETTKLLDNGYPKSMERWRGIPSRLDAAIHWIDNCTYFFKGLYCWKFNNDLIQADHRYPIPTPQTWFGCPETEEIFKMLPTSSINKYNKYS